ncbi:unnamed protein product [Caenorhabditis bovis]|uniref:Ubiquitin-like-conjugating enzyme ATG10 n=1 Tax=Caenorhabditis bovis TaxID=2654633 RepID=A0A8S1FG19_9PELO|nr:unnamed protein product [Caenorhabditis bovis]
MNVQEFNTQLHEFCRTMNELSTTPWNIIKDEIGEYARQICGISTPEGEILNRDVYIVYSETYRVPVLWFNFFRQDGRPILIDDLKKVLKNLENEPTSSLLSRMSHGEHPHLGVLYYNIHPCNTNNVMNQLKSDENFIARWMSIYGPDIGISIPLEYFACISSKNQKI